MRLHILTTDATLAGTLMTALVPGKVFPYATSPEILNYLLKNRHRSEDILLVDLATTPDAERFLLFLTSTPLRTVPVVTIGSADNYASLAPPLLASLVVTLRTPQTPADVAAIARALRTIRPSDWIPAPRTQPKPRWG
jgi:hypothetical protein